MDVKEQKSAIQKMVLPYFEKGGYPDPLGAVRLWMRTLNPVLGGASPDYMIECGRITKLENAIKESMQ